MKHESLFRRVLGPQLAVWLALLWALPAVAQDAPQPGASDEPTPAAAASDAAAPKKVRGRLPAYFGKVVNDKQREQIYDIQAKFSDQIAKLQKELDELIVRRDAEVEQVLTDEQRAEIARLKSERKSRRASGTPTDATTPAGS